MNRPIRRSPGPPQRGGTPVARRPSNKPPCPTHSVEMAYDPARMVWGCTVPTCKMIALPKDDIDAGKGKPRIGEGKLEIVRQHDGRRDRWLLRAPDNNVLLDITEYMTRVETDDSAFRGSPVIEVTLRLTNITEIR